MRVVGVMHERDHNSVAPFAARYDRWVLAAARRRRRRRLRLTAKVVVTASIVVVALGAALYAFACTCLCSHGVGDSARNQSYEIAKSIDIFRLQHGRYPHDLDELVTPLRPHKGIMEALPRDPWGNAYLYFAPGWRNVDKFDVVSRGEDGIAFTDDDMGNWHE